MFFLKKLNIKVFVLEIKHFADVGNYFCKHQVHFAANINILQTGRLNVWDNGKLLVKVLEIGNVCVSLIL
jgi:hypothetical protein